MQFNLEAIGDGSPRSPFTLLIALATERLRWTFRYVL